MLLDQFDRKLLAALQRDARLTNSELAEAIGLSASQCSRRRTRLEEAGIITGYQTSTNREALGLSITSIVAVSLAAHDIYSASRLEEMFAKHPNILEVHQMTGDMDYYLKVVTKDLAELSGLISETLLPHRGVQNVKTGIVLKTIKETAVLPLEN